MEVQTDRLDGGIYEFPPTCPVVVRPGIIVAPTIDAQGVSTASVGNLARSGKP